MFLSSKRFFSFGKYSSLSVSGISPEETNTSVIGLVTIFFFKLANDSINFSTFIFPSESFKSLRFFKYEMPFEYSEIAPYLDICASEFVIAK